MNMEYLAGFRALGHDIIYLEDCGDESWVYDWDSEQITTSLDAPANYVRDCLEPLGLGEQWIYRAGDAAAGMAISDFRDLCRDADLFIVHAVPIERWREEYDWP